MSLDPAGRAPAIVDRTYELFIGGRWVPRRDAIDVVNPFDRQRVATVASADSADVAAAVAAADAALSTAFPSHARYRVLMRTADRIEARQDEYAWTIAREGSKTIREAVAWMSCRSAARSSVASGGRAFGLRWRR